MQACRACGLNQGKLRFVIADNRVLQCRECGHVYLDAGHDQQTIREMYETYEAGRDFYFQHGDEVTRNIDSYLGRCRDFCQSSANNLRLLDIGSGAGLLLARAKAKQFVCEGIEICEPLAQVTEDKVGCRVHRAFLSDADLPDNSFDVVTMYDLIEHLRDPVDDVRRVHRLLKTGGILFLLTPNNDALMRRLAEWSYRLTLHAFQRPLRRLYYHHHLSYFNGDSLTSLLHRVGFQVVGKETRNQEMSRLILSSLEKLAVQTVFRVSERYPSLGGKLLVWARK